MTVEEKLDRILETLMRIEERQKKTTAMVEQVKEVEAVGGFGLVDHGEEKG